MNNALKSKIESEFNRALDLWHDGNSIQAIQNLKILNQKFPHKPAILGMLGAIHFAEKNWKTAKEYYGKTVELSPKSELASLGLFHSLWNLKMYDEAFEEAKRFIKLNGFSDEYDKIFPKS